MFHRLGLRQTIGPARLSCIKPQNAEPMGDRPQQTGLGKITGGIARDALTQGLRVHGLDKASVQLLMARAKQAFQHISPTTLA